MVEADGSEDVNDFLLRIRELGDRRDKEDEERTKRLEEEIIQGRKERQARRAERARSISPTKDSPASCHTPVLNHAIAQSQGSLGVTPQSMERQQISADPERRGLVSGQQPNGSPSPSTSTFALSRGGTLSWQQRPSSRNSTGPISRPLSSLAAENSTSSLFKNEPKVEATENNTPSRTQIAQSLAAKDPTWFKQTADRGLGSAALNQVKQESEIEGGCGGTRGGMPLLGMSRESKKGSEKFVSMAESARSSSPSHTVSEKDSVSTAMSAASRSLASSLSLPLPVLESQRLEPPAEAQSHALSEGAATRTFAMSPSQGRISPERLSRSSSPTKGLGGFVQSAMLKRSDSVSKRWSAQGGLGLSRGNSITSNGGVAISQPDRDTDTPVLTSTIGLENKGFVKPELPDQARKAQVGSHESRRSSTDSAEMSTPASPSRALESKKWSPSKERTWLDTALSKTDSPKPKAPPPQQPSWMAEINKAKQSRGSADTTNSTASREVPLRASPRSLHIGEALKTPKEDDYPKASTPVLAKSADSIPTPRIRNRLITSDPKLQSLNSTSSAEDSVSQSKDSASGTMDSYKIKPTIAPKKDFRPTLKPRHAPGPSASEKEPEFKNAFGRLKKTETRNYVAPDELKSNILRGKAGLAVTDGPKKSERVDEFKDSILKKKEAMKAGAVSNSPVRKSSGSRPDQNPDSSVPEAIAKRRALGRSGSSQTRNGSTPIDQTSSPGSSVKQAPPTQSSGVEVPEKKSSAPGRLQAESSSGNKLADRFNPALAGILARSIPSPGGPVRAMTASPTAVQDVNVQSATAAEGELSGSIQLAHATKARARGPKRRPPTSLKADSFTEAASENTGNGSGIQPSDGAPINAVEPTLASNKPLVTASILRPSNIIAGDNNSQQTPFPSKPRVSDVSDTTTVKNQTIDSSSRKDQLSPKPKPATPAKPSPNIAREPAPRKPSTSIAQMPMITSLVPTALPAAPTIASGWESRTVLERVEDGKSSSILPTAAKWGGSSNQTLQRSGTPRSPIKLTTQRDAVESPRELSLRKEPSKEPIGLGIQTLSKESASIASRTLPSPPVSSPRSPPLPPKKTDSMAFRIASSGSSATSSLVTSPIPESKTSNAIQLFGDLFENTSASRAKVSIDTQGVLTSRNSLQYEGKIKTLRKQIWEITGDGKRFPIASQQEHILFEGSMYLCTHVFATSTGKHTTEVYLWCGDGVSPSAIEDAQLFSRNTAKEAGVKLIILHQGKESANFFEALGGIIITRCGSSSLFGDSSAAAATYMLCGRRHMGQIAFDEVNFSPASLCSGFPYIVSATSGRLFLWKGKGSGADELGCARLIGMDLGLTGEIEEIDEGSEPEAFWKAFPRNQGKRPARSETGYWKSKASCEKYATRLFSVELETRPKFAASFMFGGRGSAPSSEELSEAVIREVSPYSQNDLDNKGIYVLDAFFEVWVMFGNQTRSKFQTFLTALFFAQEYAILAASIEDRPCIPVGGVVLRGTPAGVKAAFRKWEGPLEEKEAVVVPLNEALEAVGS